MSQSFLKSWYKVFCSQWKDKYSLQRFLDHSTNKYLNDNISCEENKISQQPNSYCKLFKVVQLSVSLPNSNWQKAAIQISESTDSHLILYQSRWVIWQSSCCETKREMRKSCQFITYWDFVSCILFLVSDYHCYLCFECFHWLTCWFLKIKIRITIKLKLDLLKNKQEKEEEFPV